MLRGILSLILVTTMVEAAPKKGFSAYGNVKYAEDFKCFDYVNPDAPKGGRLVLGSSGTFDSLNPYIIKGVAPVSVLLLTHARLMDENYDRAGENYPYLAESIDVDENGRYVIFKVNPKAKFSDDHPITADDIIWTFNTLRTEGSPIYRLYYGNVINVEKLDDYSVKFHLDGTSNAELPLILGQVPALPKHFYETHKFNSTLLIPAPSSGPYVIDAVDPGRSITFKRIQNWWGESVPSQRGQYNFDEIRFDFYLDANTEFEAFKAGKVDLRMESSIKNWKTSYDFPAVREGFIVREEVEHQHNAHTYGFFFNTRRSFFSDVKVREAITLAFDFTWANKHLFYGSYQRNESYFPNSCFAARGLPNSEEKDVLEPYVSDLPSEVFQKEFTLPEPKTPEEGHNVLKRSLVLLEEAGWRIKDQVLINDQTGEPFEFELLLRDRSVEKLGLLLAKNLKKLGIQMRIRTVDSTTYSQRVEHQNFDMILGLQPQSNSLGNEQRDFFGSSRADTVGSRNLMGIKNKVVDALVEKLIQSKTYPQLCSRGRALDRVLLWNYYMIPAWHRTNYYVAYWDKFDHPKIMPKYYPSVDFLTWWYDPEKAAEINREKKKDETASWFEKIKKIFH